MHDVYTIKEKILSRNAELADENRRILKERGIFTVNIISSPGAGKTSIIEKTLESLTDRCRVAVIEGDLQTEIDSTRLKRYGIPVRQITTGRTCHLDAHMVHHTLPWLMEQGDIELLIIENVGNMVCPAEYDLGEDMKVVVMSVPEGDDKPLKYPSIFHASDILIINKIDLVGYTNFNIDRARENALRINPGLEVFETSCTQGKGIKRWCELLLSRIPARR